MLKISEVAKKLGVESYLIFERITLDSDIFKKHIHKIQSVRYVDEEGVSLLQKMIQGSVENEIILDEEMSIDSEASFLKMESSYFPLIQSENKDELFLKREEIFIKKIENLDEECACLEREIKAYRQKLVFLDEKLIRLENSLNEYFNRVLNL